MESAASSKSIVHAARAPIPISWVRGTAIGAIGVLIAVGILLFARRVAGAATADLSAPHLLSTAILAAVMVFGGRFVWRRALSRERRELGAERLIGWGGSAAIVLLALGCSLGRGVDWALWLPLVAADQWQVRWFLGSRESRVESREPDRSVGARLSALDSRPPSIPPMAAPSEVGECVLQQLVRVREADGSEAAYGTLRAEFVAGQRHATLHVGFCPPLERLPVVEAAVSDEAEAVVKVVQAFCHGARLEVRLGEAAEENCSVAVELSAKPQAAV